MCSTASRQYLRAIALVWIALWVAAAIPPAAAQERVPIGSFEIDRTEVTVGQFRAFAVSRGLQTAAEREGGGFEYVSGWTRRPGWTWSRPFGTDAAADEPAVHVTWSEAHQFCAAEGGRLPSFAEWSAAAYTEMRSQPTDGFVSGRTYMFPVGDTPDGMNTSRVRHVAVATTKRGVNGLFDMGANVWEWLADREGETALTAGGSWWYGPEQTRAEGRQWKPATFYAVYIGFRCVYDRRAS
jgi:formylglycine-generating enzyme required for sulfatase activity